jgi:hypothetical protein
MVKIPNAMRRRPEANRVDFLETGFPAVEFSPGRAGSEARAGELGGIFMEFSLVVSSRGDASLHPD